MIACDPSVARTTSSGLVAVRGRTILLVDDDPDMRAVLGQALAARGYLVEAHANGADALAYLRAAPRPRVILLDLHMPIMDGYAFRAAQLQDSALAAIPVIVISDQRTVERARLAHVELVPKPFTMARLVGAIEQLR